MDSDDLTPLFCSTTTPDGKSLSTGKWNQRDLVNISTPALQGKHAVVVPVLTSSLVSVSIMEITDGNFGNLNVKNRHFPHFPSERPH